MQCDKFEVLNLRKYCIRRGFRGPRLRNKCVENVWGRKPRTFFTFVLRNLSVAILAQAIRSWVGCGAGHARCCAMASEVSAAAGAHLVWLPSALAALRSSGLSGKQLRQATFLAVMVDRQSVRSGGSAAITDILDDV